jgi:hypothetical protein
MKQRHIIVHYFTGYADWALKRLEYRKQAEGGQFLAVAMQKKIIIFG